MEKGRETGPFLILIQGCEVMYKRSAHVYDWIYESRFDYRASADDLRQIVQQRMPGAKSWLDVACGTGLHLGYLTQHYEVQGMDLSPEMLAVAKQRLPHVPLVQADMLSFDLGRSFDVVSCLFSSIGYMQDTPHLMQAVSAMARHLTPGGVVLVEPWLAPDQWTDGHISADFVDQPEIKLARMNRSRREGKMSRLELHHLVLTTEGADYFVEDHELFMFTDEEYRDAFLAAGLRVEHIDGGLAARGLYIGSA